MQFLKRLWKNYNLSLVLAGLFFLTWSLQFLSPYYEVVDRSLQEGRPFTWSEFWPQFLSSTFENWQSEFLQLLTFVVLTAFLIHKDSAESRDSTDRLERKIDELLKKS